MIPTSGYYIRAERPSKYPAFPDIRWWAGSRNGWMDVIGHAHMWSPVNRQSKAAASKAVRALRKLSEAERDDFTVKLMVRR